MFKEEIFGPVAPIFKFSTEEEAINMGQRHGVRAGFVPVFEGARAAAGESRKRIDYGMVGVNETIDLFRAYIPFGGVKESGLGREGSRYGIDEYLELKYICMGNLGQ